MDTGRTGTAVEHHTQRRKFVGAGLEHAVTGLLGGLGVSTDYLLGIEATATVNVSGLSEKDVAVLAALADRLRVHRE